MKIFVQVLCVYYFVSRTLLSGDGYILQKDRNPCASSLFFETVINPSSAELTDKQRRINNPFISVNPSEEEISEETRLEHTFRSLNGNVIEQNLQGSKSDLEVNDIDLVQTHDSESRRNIFDILQFSVNMPESAKKSSTNIGPVFQPLIQFDEHLKSLLCPSTIQIEINPYNLLRSNLKHALEVDVKINPSNFQEFSEFLEKKSSEHENLDNTINIDFRRLISNPQIILHPYSSEQNITIKPEVKYIYLLLPKNESVISNKNQVGIDDKLSHSHTDLMQVGVNSVEVNSERSSILDVKPKLEILHTPSIINELSNNTSEILHSENPIKEENGYELKVEESEEEPDSKEVDLSFIKYAVYRRRH